MSELSKRLRNHFGVNASVIHQQKQVTNDVYNILKDLGMKPQIPENVATSTRNNIHKIFCYPFKSNANNFGRYEHSICLEINTEYKFEHLEKIVKQALQNEEWNYE